MTFHYKSAAAEAGADPLAEALAAHHRVVEEALRKSGQDVEGVKAQLLEMEQKLARRGGGTSPGEQS